MNTSLSPITLQWARMASGLTPAELAEAVGATVEEVEYWEVTGEIDTDTVVEIAKKTKVPFGFLFLPAPPENKLPISDFRRIAGDTPPPPSSRLLSIVYRSQRRQEWYREFLISQGSDSLPFVGSKTIQSPLKDVAREIASTLHIGALHNRDSETWEETINRSIEHIESAGIIVSKVSFSDDYTHNTLSVDEFRGFALSDPYAPLVFVNGADAPSAQMFTLAHEVVHIWLGESAVSNLDQTYAGSSEIERYCNAVAAEILVPIDKIKSDWDTNDPVGAEISRLSRAYRVSKIVMARRGRDVGFVSPEYYSKLYNAQITAARQDVVKFGNYYSTKPYEASRRFSAAIITDARSGRTMVREAMDLLGIKKMETFQRYARALQITF